MFLSIVQNIQHFFNPCKKNFTDGKKSFPKIGVPFFCTNKKSAVADFSFWNSNSPKKSRRFFFASKSPITTPFSRNKNSHIWEFSFCPFKSTLKPLFKPQNQSHYSKSLSRCLASVKIFFKAALNTLTTNFFEFEQPKPSSNSFFVLKSSRKEIFF